MRELQIINVVCFLCVDLQLVHCVSSVTNPLVTLLSLNALPFLRPSALLPICQSYFKGRPGGYLLPDLVVVIITLSLEIFQLGSFPLMINTVNLINKLVFFIMITVNIRLTDLTTVTYIPLNSISRTGSNKALFFLAGEAKICIP